MENFIADISLYWYIVFIVIGFLAGYVDAVAGGGGMLQVPVLLLSGMPPVMVLATNKMVSIFGTAMAIIKYGLSKKINWHVIKIAILACLVTSFIGSQLVMQLSSDTISWLIILCIPFALLALFYKDSVKRESIGFSNKSILLSTTPVGFYDGLLGPGTGTYLALSMKRFLNLDLLSATATAKPLNFATNFGALLAFVSVNAVVWSVAIPMLIANMIGGYVGSHYAIKNGEQFIKKMMLTVLAIILIANIFKLI